MKLAEKAIVATVVLVAAVIAFDWLWSRRDGEIERLVVERDSLAARTLAKIETVTVYVARADSSKARSDRSKRASDAADQLVDIVDSTTLAVRVTPTAPPRLVITPAEVVADLVKLRKTSADQAVTILDLRAAVSRATDALADARTIIHTDSVVIRKLAANQCDRRCKLLVFGSGLALGLIVR